MNRSTQALVPRVFSGTDLYRRFQSQKKVAKIVLAVDEWSDLEIVKIPFDFTIGAGL